MTAGLPSYCHIGKTEVIFSLWRGEKYHVVSAQGALKVATAENVPFKFN
jgi:hypothetical protein